MSTALLWVLASKSNQIKSTPIPVPALIVLKYDKIPNRDLVRNPHLLLFGCSYFLLQMFSCCSLPLPIVPSQFLKIPRSFSRRTNPFLFQVPLQYCLHWKIPRYFLSFHLSLLKVPPERKLSSDWLEAARSIEGQR